MIGTSVDRQDRYWEEDTAHRPAHHPVVAGFARQRWRHAARLLPLDEIRSVLDVGAGSGFSAVHAPGHLEFTCADRSHHMLTRNPVDRRLQADITELPFADRAFDLVICWEVLHHVPDPAVALAEMARVARRWLLIFEPNPLNLAQLLFALVDREHRWVMRYSSRFLQAQLARAGLRVSHHQRVGLIFPNRTPPWLFALLRALPFRWPLLGISHMVVAERR